MARMTFLNRSVVNDLFNYANIQYLMLKTRHFLAVRKDQEKNMHSITMKNTVGFSLRTLSP